MHHAIQIPEHEGSYVLATDSSEGVETAVIFVHGFLGDAYKTWVDFQGRVEEEEWASADLYFWQYDSFRASIPASAARFLDFAEEVQQAPEEWFRVPPESVPGAVRHALGALEPLRTGTTSYRRLVLVGHSLGGVVLREAIKDCARVYERALAELVRQPEDGSSEGLEGLRKKMLEGERPPAVPLLLQAELRLFAPAIAGARPAGLAGLALEFGGVRRVAQLFLGFSRSFKELKPEMGLVGDLREKTEAYARKFQWLGAFVADVLWGEDDDIVIPRSYHQDRDRERVRDKNHSSVCKPGDKYRKPLDLVVRGDV